MHDLEKSIAAWRQAMATAPGIGRETLDELEDHLREHAERLVRSGLGEAEAFQRALTELGSPPAIASEFRKLNPPTWWPVKVVVGIGIAVALLLAGFLAARFETGRLNLLLAIHVFTVTLGYTSVFLLGFLGICFVGRRCYSDVNPASLKPLVRFSFIFGCVAAGLTAVGIVLGAVWARGAWGRYWAWDLKETGGLCVLVWLICFLIAHRLRQATARGVLVMSVLGNIVVGLAWFGGNLASRLQAYGTPDSTWLLVAAVIPNLVVLMAGLAPAGWLRRRKAVR